MFKEAAESVAGGVLPGKEVAKDAFDAHEMITIFREKAREQLCPIINSVDPDYPGKINL